MKIISTNRKAAHNYHIFDTIEAGIILTGSEVKSLRDYKSNLDNSYVAIIKDELYLISMHIDQYKYSWQTHEPKRNRKLLLHKKEIHKVIEKSSQKGFTIVPLKIYFNEKEIVKVQIAVVKGKKLFDKREDQKIKQFEIDIKRSNKWRI